MNFYVKTAGRRNIFSVFIARLVIVLFLSIILISDFSGNLPSRSPYRSSGKEPLSMDKIMSLIRAGLPERKPVVKIERAVKKGDTLIDILSRAGVEIASAHQFFLEINHLFDLRKIRAGQKYVLILENGGIKLFRYEIDTDRCLKVFRGRGSRFSGKIEPIVFTVRRKVIRGIVSDSLFLTILELGEGPELADMLASLYEYDIDFNRDVMSGDSFALLFEKKYRNGVFARYGSILAAEFQNRNRLIRILRYNDPGGKTDYYHPDGRAVKKMFLRCPLPFMRVSSGYGLRRHPLLGFSTRHSGVDLMAPPGTRIRATASGVITRSAFDRIKGRHLIIRHPNRYATHYYHLSGIKSGVRPGKSVSQGDIIGCVGRSGRTTGSHLHYGVKKNGRFINPFSLKSPSKNPVKKAYIEAFKKYSSALFFLLSENCLLPIPDKLQEILLTGFECDSIQAAIPSIK